MARGPNVDVQPSLAALDCELWSRGELRFLTREHHQREIYDACERWVHDFPGDPGPILINSHRKMGKSYFLDLLCWKRAIKRPWQIVRYLTPSYKQGRDYLFDIHRQIESICPKPLRPEWSGDKLVFKNPRWAHNGAYSEIGLYGMREPDSARGPRCNLAVCDEVREWDRLSYVFDDILLYQFIGQEDPLCVVSTTPPASMAHEYVTRFIPEAVARKSYFLLPMDAVTETYQPWYAKRPMKGRHNPDISDADRHMVLKLCGGRKSVSWQREALCKLLSDPDKLIVPEFREVRSRCVVKFDLPAHFNAYTGIDFGWADANGALIAAVDFLARKLLILEEVWAFNQSTGQLARAIRRAEEKHFLCRGGEKPRSRSGGKGWRFHDIARVGDHSQQQLNDLLIDHDIAILKAEKWDKMAFLSQLRYAISQEQILIHPRCQQLTNQLANGIWKPTLDGARKDFIRNDVLGHCDLIDALLYLYRRVSLEENPYPKKRPDRGRFFVAPDEEDGDDAQVVWEDDLQASMDED